jgi:hypothetical protein
MIHRGKRVGVCHGGCDWGSGDYNAAQLRELAKRSDDANQTRRLLALAAIYDGGCRGELVAGDQPCCFLLIEDATGHDKTV